MSSPNAVPELHLPPYDILIDVVGNPFTADLHLLLNGNQFMVMPELIKAFTQAYPQFGRVYYETLPPGLLAQQIQAHGQLKIGLLTLDIPADVYTAGQSEMTHLKDYLNTPIPYAQNRLSLIVAPNNPLHVTGFEDLARSDLRVAMPNPETEGIARLAHQAITIAAGPSAAEAVFTKKVDEGTTRLTTVHHRETVDWIVRGESDVGVVWHSEAQWAHQNGASIAVVPLNDWDENPVGQYWAAGLREAPHPQARDAYLDFLKSRLAATLYQQYGFAPATAATTAFSGF